MACSGRNSRGSVSYFQSGAADRLLFDVEGNVQRLQDAHGLFDDFRADAVTRQDCDVVGH